MAPSSSRNRPGVAIEQFSPPPALDFRTGVAGFLGPASPSGKPPASLPDPLQPGTGDPQQPFTTWHDFAAAFRGDKGWLADRWVPDQVLWHAVQGFFQNGGTRCWVVFYAETTSPALEAAVAKLAQIDDVDLVCAPSLMESADMLALQQQLITSFELIGDGGPRRDDWFLLLDPPDAVAKLPGQVDALRFEPVPAGQPDAPRVLRIKHPENIAIYYPWVQLGGDSEPPPLTPGVPRRKRVPPSGHVAGIFARTDQKVGVFKAPANEAIEGIVDVDDAGDVEAANPLRAFPGRGIRVWGARTLATDQATGASRFVNVRRLVLTLERWLMRALDWVVFEANDFPLWVRVNRELNAKLGALFLQGAFAGETPDEAFSVKCDAENNPAELRASGRLQIDIQIAPIVPKEFIQIRVVRNAEGLTVT